MDCSASIFCGGTRDAKFAPHAQVALFLTDRYSSLFALDKEKKPQQFSCCGFLLKPSAASSALAP